ncbi:NusG domain II-containing protein [Gorillibacterium massiliense]|uniref:NusG domain II-containing protein n=1 Tax=Gorillibacterium massiliense TaxID=1280390 RepID=UPI0004B2ED44|nr:NusG domain II-containing protein [Gorillibacterium massiliense]
MKRGDILLGVIVLAIAAFFLVPKFTHHNTPASGARYAKITIDGDHYKTVELTKEASELDIKSKYGYNILKIYNNGAQMIDADCPDKVCLTFGFVSKVGQTIVCLPHRVLVEIVDENGKGNGDIDAVVQ